MGLLDRLLGTKKMYKDAMNGVDMVKVGLMYYLLPECEVNFGKEYSAPLVAAVVNTVFSDPPSNEIGRQFILDENNVKNVLFVVEKGIKPVKELRKTITDSVRVKCTLSHSMNPKLTEPDFVRLCREPIDNLKRLGLLIPGGEMPELNIFLHNAGIFVQTCKADFDHHNSQERATSETNYQSVDLPLTENTCLICGKEFSEGDATVSTSGCAFPQSHKLWRYCDAPLHLACMEMWSDCKTFSNAYYVQRRQQFLDESWFILAEEKDWFVGFIPPGLYQTKPGYEDLVEIRIRDWPFILYGHADEWTQFFSGGWQKYQPALSGKALYRAREVMSQVRRVIPDTQAIVELINKLLKRK